MENDYEGNRGGYDDEPRYDRERSASPRPKRDDGYRSGRDRSASPGGRLNSRPPPAQPIDDEEAARNEGTNLFVTGLSGGLSEDDVRRMFEKYGEVKSAAIMRDPHSGDSRGFGFVELMTAEQADAAREGLQGESINGRTLSIEKARRKRPRTPTPGRYFGPPKRDDRPRRGGYGGGGYGRDDFYRGYDDRRGYGGGGRRDDGGGRGIDRYASRGGDRYSRDDRYGGRDDRYGGRDDRRGDDRRGGGDGYYRDAPSYGGDDRYNRR